MLRRASRFLDLRPGEGLPVLLIFLYMAVVVASFLLAKPIRNALFLNEYGAYRLVYVFVGVPVVLSVFVPFYSWIAARYGHRVVTTASLLGFCLSALAFWYLLAFHRTPALPAVFFIWVNCYGVIAPVQVWTFANSVFDTRQAKRLFGVIGSGASLGAITGGLLAMSLVRPLGGTVNLLLVLAGLIAVAALIVNVAWVAVPVRVAQRSMRAAQVSLPESFRLIGQTPYLRLLVATVFLVAIVTQWTGFQLSLIAHERYAGDRDLLTVFFGRFNFALGALAFLVQLFLTGSVLRRWGIALTIVLLPLSLGFGSALIVLFPLLWTVLLTNALDQGIRFSLDKATYELLYLPLSAAVRTKVKVMIDTVINRLADAVGGVLLGLATLGFLGLPGAGFGLRGTALVNLGFIAAWAAVAMALRRGYVDTIRQSIQQHRLELERSAAPVLDRSVTDVLVRTIATGDSDEIRYALGLLEMQQEPSGHPVLHELLSHPSPDIRRRAIAILSASGDRSALPEIDRMLQDPDLGTRTEALLYLTRFARMDPLERLQEIGDFPDFSIRAGMVAFLARPGRTQNLDAARLLLDTMVRDRTAAGRRGRAEAARLMALLPDEFPEQLAELLRDQDEEVAREAIRSAGRLHRVGFAGPIVDRLGEPGLTGEAADMLAGLGDEVVPLLRERLFDDAAPLELRREVPGVLVRIATPGAERVLMEALLQGDATLRLRVIASLNKLRQARPDLELDAATVEMILAAEITGHYRSYQVLARLEHQIGSEDAVVVALHKSIDQEVERIFRLMNLLFPQHDLHSAYVGLRSNNRLVRANALEFLDNILSPQLRSLVVPLLDGQVSVAERAALADRFVGAPVDTLEQAVGTLLQSDNAWLRSCAAYAVGALQLDTLAPALERALEDPDLRSREAARAARQRLEGVPEAVVEAPPGPDRAWQASETIGVG